MADFALKLIAYTHDHLNPLVTGDVVPRGIDLRFDRTAPLSAVYHTSKLRGYAAGPCDWMRSKARRAIESVRWRSRFVESIAQGPPAAVEGIRVRLLAATPA